jgi:hypothetical protein
VLPPCRPIQLGYPKKTSLTAAYIVQHPQPYKLFLWVLDETISVLVFFNFGVRLTVAVTIIVLFDMNQQLLYP